MQSFMAVPVDAITRMHGLSHRAHELARGRRESVPASQENARDWMTDGLTGGYAATCWPHSLVHAALPRDDAEMALFPPCVTKKCGRSDDGGHQPS